MKVLYLLLFYFLFTSNSLPNEIVTVDGENLYYDTYTSDIDIDWDHYDLIENVLKANPQITKLILNLGTVLNLR